MNLMPLIRYRGSDSQTIIKESGWTFGGLISKLLGGLIDIVLEIVKSLITLVTDLIGRLFTSLFDFISTALSNISSFTAEVGQVPSLINGILEHYRLKYKRLLLVVYL